MAEINQEYQLGPEQSLPLDEPSLFDAISKRKRRSLEVKLDKETSDKLAMRVVYDFTDAQNANRDFRLNHLEFLNNWRATPEPVSEDHPLGDLAANVKVPLTTTYIEQWKARLSKVILPEGNVARFYSIVETLDQEVLKKLAQWFNWELYNIVNIEKVIAEIMHYALVDGICMSVPSYERTVKRVLTCREFDFNTAAPLSQQIEAGINQCFTTLGFKLSLIGLTETPGEYEVTLEGQETPAAVSVIIDEDAIIFELEFDDVVFDGVKVEIPNIEDIVVMNTDADVNKLPFFGIRTWFSVAEFTEMWDKNELIPNLDESMFKTICSQADSKTSDFIPQYNSREQDLIEGADSLAESSARGQGDEKEGTRTWIEVYRWEGEISYKKERIGVVAWVAVRAQTLIKIERREKITKDGSRTCIKHDFIPVPGRFYSIGMCELLRHVQTEMDGIHNFRLNSALVATVPFGFYAPTAGAPATIIGLKPGNLYPVKDPNAIVFPRLGWNAVWGFEEEGLVRKYGSELAGMGDSGTGTYTSKRTSASEFLGTTAALDIRTEHIAKGVLRQIEVLFYRIFSLYQQHSKGDRVFLIAGLDGHDIMEKLSTDMLQGRLKLQLMGTVEQLSQQLKKETAMQMLSVLLNQFAISLGIVGPDTIYAAMAKVMEASQYKGVPIHKPQTPPDSPPPHEELVMMNAGIPVEPHVGEDFGMHLQAHMMIMQRPDFEKIVSPIGMELLSKHIQMTMSMQQQVEIQRQQQALEAAQMQSQFAKMGVRPGQAGATDSSAVNAGSQAEGVAAPANAPQNAT